jgi:hypothetical protein
MFIYFLQQMEAGGKQAQSTFEWCLMKCESTAKNPFFQPLSNGTLFSGIHIFSGLLLAIAAFQAGKIVILR